MNANWAHRFTRWSCSFTARRGRDPHSLCLISINPILVLHLLESSHSLWKSSRVKAEGKKVSSICWWCVTVATVLSATKVSAAGSVRAGERERTNNVLDGNPRGEEVHRESGVISKGGMRNEASLNAQRCVSCRDQRVWTHNQSLSLAPTVCRSARGFSQLTKTNNIV